MVRNCRSVLRPVGWFRSAFPMLHRVVIMFWYLSHLFGLCVLFSIDFVSVDVLDLRTVLFDPMSNVALVVVPIFHCACPCPLIQFHSLSFCLFPWPFRRQYWDCYICDSSVLTMYSNPFWWSAIDRARSLGVCILSDALWFKLLCLCTRFKRTPSKVNGNMRFKNTKNLDQNWSFPTSGISVNEIEFSLN